MKRTKLFTRDWWEATRNRMARSAAQGFVGSFGATTLEWMQADWRFVAYATAGMGVLAFATAILLPPSTDYP